MSRVSGNLIVGFDFSWEDEAVICVGCHENGVVKIVNVFQGNEAVKIFTKLTHGVDDLDADRSKSAYVMNLAENRGLTIDEAYTYYTDSIEEIKTRIYKDFGISSEILNGG